MERGISRLCQIRNAEGIILSKGALEQKYDFQIDEMAYNCLIDAIPTACGNNTCHKKDNLQNEYLVGGFVFDIRKLTNRMVYENLLNRLCKPPTAVEKWIDLYPLLGNNFWNEIFTIPNRTLKDTKIHTFQYKTINRIINCNENLAYPRQ